MKQSQTWPPKDHLQHYRALPKACYLVRFLNRSENGPCHSKSPEGVGTVGLNDLQGLFQPKLFYDSTI